MPTLKEFKPSLGGRYIKKQLQYSVISAMRVISIGYYGCLGVGERQEIKVEQKLTRQRREVGKGWE